jgi:hypothetical protein
MILHVPAHVSWAPLAGAVLLTVAACAASPASPSGVQGGVLDGSWGGVGIRIDATASGVQIEFDCAHATLAPLLVDGENRFDVDGILVLERGGPVRQGEPERAAPARYSGRLDYDTLTMVVTLTETAEAGERFSATRGAAPRLRKCR